MKNYFIVFVIVLIIGSLFWEIYLPKDSLSKEQILFNIRKGEGSREISLNLEKEGLIKWGPLYRLYVLTTGASGSLQAGTYLLSPSMNISEITEKFINGEVAKIRVTIPEGSTASQIYQKLKDIAHLRIDTLKEHEGYLFPDTYEINYGMEEEKIVKMMLGNFKKKTANLKITPQVVIMASLLEKELKTKEDKELAAGILWKRLKVGMPLQVDAEMWTYEHQGLPSRPICNPGLESIKAAIYPKNSKFWYYLSTPNGETIFSKTLEEHNYAKSKYLKTTPN
jgi:UPF0755 protein